MQNLNPKLIAPAYQHLVHTARPLGAAYDLGAHAAANHVVVSATDVVITEWHAEQQYMAAGWLICCQGKQGMGAQR